MFTIEPGIYIPEESLGVRIEDDSITWTDQDGHLDQTESAASPSKRRKTWKKRWLESKMDNFVIGGFLQSQFRGVPKLLNCRIVLLQTFYENVFPNVFVLRGAASC